MNKTTEDTEITFTPQQYAALERVRYVCWKGEGAHAASIVALGDTASAITATAPRHDSALTQAIAAYIDAPVSKVHHCRLIAAYLATPAMRAKVTGKVGVCFTVLRSAACNYDGSDFSDWRRWRILVSMIDAAERDATPTISTTAYRKAIAGRPIPNSTRALTPDHLAALLTHKSFRHRLMDEINAHPDWAKEQRARRAAAKRQGA